MSWCACEYGNQLVYLHKPHLRITLQTLTGSHLITDYCTVMLDPRDPLLQYEKTQGFAAVPVFGRA